MILAAIAPAFVAFAMFFGSLRPRRPDLRVTTKAEREAVAARSREGRPGPYAFVYVLMVLLAPLTIAALHVLADRDPSFVPGELR